MLHASNVAANTPERIIEAPPVKRTGKRKITTDANRLFVREELLFALTLYRLPSGKVFPGRHWSHQMRKLRYPFIFASLFLISVFLFFVVLQERPFFPGGTPPGKELRTALAIQGPESPFGQWAQYFGSKGYLTKSYNDVKYFTESSYGECRKSFIVALDAALVNYPVVDIYIFAHTNNYIDWVKDVPEGHRNRLRFVYNTGCGNLTQGPDWLKAGAKAYIGHPGKSSSEIFGFFFIRRWTRGYALNEAVDQSNAHMGRAMRSWYILSVFRDTKLAKVPSELSALLSASWSGETALRESWAECYGDSQLKMGSLP